MSDEVLVWLSVWSEVQIVCMPLPSPEPHHLLHHLNSDWFYFSVPDYTGCPMEKRQFNRCSSSSVCTGV